MMTDDLAEPSFEDPLTADPPSSTPSPRSGIDPRAICEFNFTPTRYIHPSWLESFSLGQHIAGLIEHRRVSGRIDRYLLQQLQLEDKYWFDFSNPIYQLALLPGEKLALLVLYMGLVLNADIIRKTISREEVLKIRSSLSDEEYRFAVKKAPELGISVKLPSFSWKYSENYRAHSIVCGLKCLAVPFAGNNPPAIVQRLLLKFPMNWHRSFTPPYASDEECDAIRSLLLKIKAELN